MNNQDIALKVENLDKVYRLGEIGTGTISHDLNRWWAKIRGKQDPYAKIGSSNDRTQEAKKGEYVKVLNDINFEVKEGEVLGIIGKNGAGKSTLLKVISQITSPTNGSIKAKGRIASLLEVGTGMHPEMTGKENVYLNGTILGMTKKEIDDKFDEIMDFAGCAKYANTPVKRYSSGMKVRLGFAVAAFLEPEILIVDEVLAVGDAEFQKKAIGKMQDISSGGGRTVLFVSHNMNSVNRLCTKAMMLKNGEIYAYGKTDVIVNEYLNDNVGLGLKSSFESIGQTNKDIELCSFKILNEDENLVNSPIEVTENFKIEIKLRLNVEVQDPNLTIHIRNSRDESVFFNDIKDLKSNKLPNEEGEYRYVIKIEQPLLKPEIYNVSLGITNKDNAQTNHFRDIVNFQVVDMHGVRENRPGAIFRPQTWDLKRYNER